MEGQIDVLNVGHGHLEVRFNPNDPMETERAKRVITDLIQRGAVLFIHGEGEQLIRVEQFDPVKNVYLIADFPGTTSIQNIPEPERRIVGRMTKREVPAEKVHVTAVGRSAGG